MKELLLLIAAIPVLALTYHLWGKAYGLAVEHAKEVNALKVANAQPEFARAYNLMQKYAATVYTQEAPWNREERGPRAVEGLRRSV